MKRLQPAAYTAFFILLALFILTNFARAETARSEEPQILTPRLQVDIPGIQPFTKPALQTVEIPGTDTERKILDIDFISVYLIGLYQYLVGIAAIVAGVMIVWAGFRWLTSGGSPDRIGDAKKKIAGALVGMALVFGSYMIVYLINPDLVFFKPLRITKIERIELETFEGKDLETETIIEALPITSTQYDDIFERFANCIPADWRFLKAIAYKESGLNTNKVNPSGYTGLFQTKQKNCESALRQYPQHTSQCSNLTNPSVNTAVGALMMKSAVQRIERNCAASGIREKLTMVYINHNMGPGVLQHAMGFGCALEKLKEGSIDYYKTKGAKTAESYANQYQNACLQSGKSAAECTGGPKFDYAVSTAQATQALGVGQIGASSTGPCPLDAAQPF